MTKTSKVIETKSFHWSKNENWIRSFLDFESEKFKNTSVKFHYLFKIPEKEKLVVCTSRKKENVKKQMFIETSFSFLFCLDYSCSNWRGRVPRPGLLYLSINYLCFFSNFLGKEILFVVKFSDIIVRYFVFRHVFILNSTFRLVGRIRQHLCYRYNSNSNAFSRIRFYSIQ